MTHLTADSDPSVAIQRNLSIRSCYHDITMAPQHIWTLKLSYSSKMSKCQNLR